MQVVFAVFKFFEGVYNSEFIFSLPLTKKEICIVSNVMLFKRWLIVALSWHGPFFWHDKWWVMPQLFNPAAFNISCTIYTSMEEKCTLGVGEWDYAIFSPGEWETFRLRCSFSVCRITRVPFISSFKPRFWVRIILYPVWDKLRSRPNSN